MDAITLTESNRFVVLESKIKAGLDSFMQVAEALVEIRDSRLYRIEHATFDDYCKSKWNFNSSRARQLIGAAETSENLRSVTTGNTLPTKERQVRPLAKLPAEQQQAVYSEAVKLAGGKQPSSKQVEQAVQTNTRPIPAPVFTPEQERNYTQTAKDSEKLRMLKSTWKGTTKKDKAAFEAWVKAQSFDYMAANPEKRVTYLPDLALGIAQTAVCTLQKIAPNDTERSEAFRKVIEYCNARLTPLNEKGTPPKDASFERSSVTNNDVKAI